MTEIVFDGMTVVSKDFRASELQQGGKATTFKTRSQEMGYVQELKSFIAGAKGERRVAARDFFKGMYETALQPGEVLVAGEFKIAATGYRAAFLELARRHGDYAIVGLAAQADCSGGKYSGECDVFKQYRAASSSTFNFRPDQNGLYCSARERGTSTIGPTPSVMRIGNPAFFRSRG